MRTFNDEVIDHFIFTRVALVTVNIKRNRITIK